MYRFNMVRVPNPKLHRPVDAGAGIPAAVGLQGIVHKNGDGVFPGAHRAGNIHVKGGEAIAVGTGRRTVHGHGTVLINPFKMEDNRLPDGTLRKRKGLFVAVPSPGKIAGVDAVPTFAVPPFQKHGVVGKVDLLPRAALLLKRPVLVKVNHHVF